MKRRLWYAFSATLLLLGTGCGKATELNELSIATGTGIDGKKGDYSVTYQVSVASASASATGSGSGGDSTGVHVFSTFGKTLHEAISMSGVEDPRKIYFAHNGILVLSKETAEDGITSILDSYFRNPDLRETAKVLVTQGKARDILTKNIPPEKLPGQAIAEIIDKENQFVSFYPATTVFELALGITSESRAGVVPEIGISGENEKELESTKSMSKTAQDAKLRLTGLAIFKGDRYAGKMNLEESMGLSWLTDRVKNTTLSFPDPKGEENLSAVKIYKAKVKVTPVKGPLHYTVNVRADVSGELIETTSGENLDDTAGINQLKKQIEQVILAQMEKAWAATKRLKVDVLGIGNMIHAHYPKEWQNLKPDWEEEMALMDLNAKVKVNVVRTRLFLNSFEKLLDRNDE